MTNIWGSHFHAYIINILLNNDHLPTMVTIQGFRGWPLYIGLTVCFFRIVRLYRWIKIFLSFLKTLEHKVAKYEQKSFQIVYFIWIVAFPHRSNWRIHFSIKFFPEFSLFAKMWNVTRLIVVIRTVRIISSNILTKTFPKKTRSF